MLLLPVGWLLYSFASRTTIVLDPSLVNRGDSVIADTPEDRERLRRIASELPLLRPPDPDSRGWHVDPLRQRRFRFYDGRRWTREVSDDPARRIAAAVGDGRADLRRRLLSLPPPAETGASWHIDPLGTYQFRYFDGREWTEQVRQARGLEERLAVPAGRGRARGPAPGGGLEPPTSGSKGRRSAD